MAMRVIKIVHRGIQGSKSRVEHVRRFWAYFFEK